MELNPGAITWAGDNPYFLLIMPPGEPPIVVDLDQSAWQKLHRRDLRR